jgi:hypothetical protein
MKIRDFARAAKLRLITRFPPASAKELLLRDQQIGSRLDYGPERAVELTLNWLCRAQDMSPGRDGGVSGFYRLGSGWAASYPETTGYIICSFIDQGLRRGNDDLLDRARRMLDWLVEIQFPEGGFQGGLIDAARPVPVTFNTGQILLGLARGTEVFGDRYHDAMARAANWLVETQDADGCWRSAPTPLAAPGEKAYETHVSWGLFEAARVAGRQSWGESGLRQVRWAVSKLQPNGWMADCCMTESPPLTHTLGYALKGIIEAYRFSNDRFFLDAAVRFADGLAGCVGQDGYLAGRLRRDWSRAVDWACVTGSSQIAWSLMFLGQNTERSQYQALARKLNQFVRRTMLVAGDADLVGGVRGSFPLNGEYFPFAFPNWAAKFTLDANQFELENEPTNDFPEQSGPGQFATESLR